LLGVEDRDNARLEHAVTRDFLRDWRRNYAQALRGAAIAGLGRRDEAVPIVASAHEALARKKDVIPAERRFILQAVESLTSRLR
jgi:hypothetical protein